MLIKNILLAAIYAVALGQPDTTGFIADSSLSLSSQVQSAQSNGLEQNWSDGDKRVNGGRVIVDLGLDSGWFKFFFGQAGDPTAYVFRLASDDYVQISITDAYCPGDDWDVHIDGRYLLTTPRVPTRHCASWVDNPEKAFYNPIWSSTKFMLPGGGASNKGFNLTLWTKDSPYNGGAAFIRADSRVVSCPEAVAPFFLVTSPRVPYSQRESLCKRVGAVPAHITPANALAASKSILACLHHQGKVWFGRLSLVQMSLVKSLQDKKLGCLAFSNRIPEDPTVEVVDCDEQLPVLCLTPSLDD